jgi:CRP-like cAMP-binding protein
MSGPNDFCGEGALVKQSLRVSTAGILEKSTAFRVEKEAMIRALPEQPELSETCHRPPTYGNHSSKLAVRDILLKFA